MIMIIDLTPLPVQPRELEIDSRTGMKNYIANGASMVPLLFLTFPGIFFDTYGIMTFLFPYSLGMRRAGELGHLESAREAHPREVYPNRKAVPR